MGPILALLSLLSNPRAAVAAENFRGVGNTPGTIRKVARFSERAPERLAGLQTV
jgi:hypothetical protein